MIRCLALACSIIFLLVLLLCSPALAATAWVDDNGAAAWGACQGATPLSGAAACSLGTANSNAAAGDIIYLRAGDYTTSYILPTNSGTADGSYGCSAYITYEAYSGETPVITGGQDYGANLTGKSCIKISGISFGQHGNGNHLIRWMLFDTNSDRNYIHDCIFTNCKNYSGILFETPASGDNKYNVLDGNTFTANPLDPEAECGRTGCATDCNACPSDMVALGNCVSCLIIGNNFGRSAHTALNFAAAPKQNYTVVKNNVITNTWHSAMDTSSWDTDQTNYVVIDGNTIAFAGDNAETNPEGTARAMVGNQGYKHAGINGGFYGSIIRRNVAYNANGRSRSICVGHNKDNSQDFYNRVYNNTVNGSYYTYGSSANVSDVRFNVFKNNIGSNAQTTYSQPYVVRFYTSIGGLISDNVITRNNFYSPNCQYITTTGTVAQIEAAQPDWTNNVSPAVSPNYRSIGTYDFRLGTTSALKDAGTHLTQVNDSGGGSGTSLVVDDSYYFYSRETWQTPAHASVVSDYIYVDNPTISDFLVQITAVNRGNNTLTLASSQTWEDNALVYLAKSSVVAHYGSFPDIGAYENAIDQAPTLDLPINSATGVTRSPTLTLTRVGQTPVGGAGGTHTATQWQVSTSDNWASPWFDSGEDTVNLTSRSTWSTELAASTLHYWHARTKNSDDTTWGPWSATNTFTTGTGTGGGPGPGTPTHLGTFTGSR